MFDFKESLRQVRQALEEPEAFALRWHEKGAVYPWWVFAALALTAIAGTTCYGMTMGLLAGPQTMIANGLMLTFAAGVAWSLPLPALYILNSLAGSRLQPSTTFLAALVTTSWGGLALIASLPIAVFFTAALSFPSSEWFVLLIHLIIFGGVGVAMADVFGRVMARLEPARGRTPVVWLALVGAIGAELFYALGLFHSIVQERI